MSAGSTAVHEHLSDNRERCINHIRLLNIEDEIRVLDNVDKES